MKTAFIIFLLSVFCSCASNDKYKPASLKMKFQPVTDLSTGTRYYAWSYADVKQSYFKWQAEGRINRNPSQSCFDNAESVNYVGILDDDIPHLRRFAVDSNYSVRHRTVNTVKNEQYSGMSTEEIASDVKFKQSTCVRVVDGLNRIVVSEIYN